MIYYFNNFHNFFEFRDTTNWKDRPSTNDTSKKITIFKKLFWKIFYKTKEDLK